MAVSVMNEGNDWFLYTLLDTDEVDSIGHGENLYRITEDEAAEIQKEIASRVTEAPRKPVEFMFSRSTEGDVTTISSASSDGTAMCNSLVKDKVPESVIRIYGQAVTDEIANAYRQTGFQVEHSSEKTVIEETVAKLLNTYREKISNCTLTN